MNKDFKKVIYTKASSNYGEGAIPLQAVGDVLLYIHNPVTSKLLVDFHKYGKAIVPLSSVTPMLILKSNQE